MGKRKDVIDPKDDSRPTNFFKTESGPTSYSPALSRVQFCTTRRDENESQIDTRRGVLEPEGQSACRTRKEPE